MKSILLALAFCAMSTIALAQTPPGLNTSQTNGGGNTPNGNANGVPTTTTNNGGNAPPGQN
jgi:hypothetical protein